ncbi:MAG TPA: peptidoglycan DD-metalloendopeptidase family protein [Kofleriaceae bacterium]|nr:peptidoglycan DD-metalloendopeptidase family protein [Kofleriaceae bacterium]
MVDRRPSSRKRSSVLTLDGRPPARRGTLRLLLLLGAMVLVNLYIFVWKDGTSIRAVKARAANLGTAPLDKAGPPPPPVPAVAQGPGASVPRPTGVLEGKVEKDESLGKILRTRLHLEPAAADELIRAVGPVFDLRGLRAGQPFRLELDDDGQVQSFELTVSKTVTVRIERDHATGQLTGKKDEQQTRIEVREIGGRVDSSLYAAIKAAGEDGTLVGFFVDVFAYDVDFYNDTHDGDEFRVVVEKEFAGDTFLRYRRILAAEYAGKEGTHRAFYWVPPGAEQGRYFDEDGESLERSMLKTPLKFARVSSGFNPHRMHPILHRIKGHFGTDFACPVGTPVWAAADGVIVQAGPAGGAGNMVTIRHDNGLTTLYMHLSKIGKMTKIGQRVAAKTVIGYSGNTGLSTGPHLHFGVKKNGVYIDFQTMKPARAAGVARKDLAAYRASVKGLVARLGGISTTPAAVPAAAGPASPALAVNPPS